MTNEDLFRIKSLHETLHSHINDWLERAPNLLIKAQLRMNSKRIKTAPMREETTIAVNGHGANKETNDTKPIEE